eukprot:Rmarinus@m.3136
MGGEAPEQTVEELQKQLSELQEKLNNLETENDELDKENEELEKRLEDVETKNKGLTKQTKDLQDENDMLQEDLKTYKDKADDYEQFFNTHGGAGADRGVEVSGDVQHLKTQVEELEIDKNALERELDTKQDLLIREQEALENVKRDLDDMKREVAKKEVEVNTLREKLQDAREEISTMKRSNTTVDKDRRTLQFDVRRLREELRDRLTEINNLAEQNETLRLQKEEIEKEKDMLVEEVLALSNDADGAKGRVADLEQRADSIVDERDALKARVEQLQEEIYKRDGKIDDLVKTVQKQLESMQMRISQKDDEIEKKSSKIARLEEDNRQLREVSLVSTFKDEVELQKRAIDDKNARIKQLEEDLETTTQELMVVTEEMQRLQEGQQTAVERALRDHKVEMDNLRAKLEEKSLEIAAVNEMAQKVDLVVSERDDELATLKARMSEYERNVYGLGEAVKEIKYLKTQNKRQSEKILKLTQNLNNRETQVTDLADETRVLRKKLNIPPDELIDLSELRLETQLQLARLTAENEQLRRENREMEDERLRMKTQLRFQSVKRAEFALKMGLDDEQYSAVENFAEQLRLGHQSHLLLTDKSMELLEENKQLHKKLKEFEEKIRHLETEENKAEDLVRDLRDVIYQLENEKVVMMNERATMQHSLESLSFHRAVAIPTPSGATNTIATTSTTSAILDRPVTPSHLSAGFRPESGGVVRTRSAGNASQSHGLRVATQSQNNGLGDLTLMVPQFMPPLTPTTPISMASPAKVSNVLSRVADYFGEEPQPKPDEDDDSAREISSKDAREIRRSNKQLREKLEQTQSELATVLTTCQSQTEEITHLQQTCATLKQDLLNNKMGIPWTPMPSEDNVDEDLVYIYAQLVECLEELARKDDTIAEYDAKLNELQQQVDGAVGTVQFVYREHAKLRDRITHERQAKTNEIQGLQAELSDLRNEASGLREALQAMETANPDDLRSQAAEAWRKATLLQVECDQSRRKYALTRVSEEELRKEVARLKSDSIEMERVTRTRVTMLDKWRKEYAIRLDSATRKVASMVPREDLVRLQHKCEAVVKRNKALLETTNDLLQRTNEVDKLRGEIQVLKERQYALERRATSAEVRAEKLDSEVTMLRHQHKVEGKDPKKTLRELRDLQSKCVSLESEKESMRRRCDLAEKKVTAAAETEKMQATTITDLETRCTNLAERLLELGQAPRDTLSATFGPSSTGDDAPSTSAQCVQGGQGTHTQEADVDEAGDDTFARRAEDPVDDGLPDVSFPPDVSNLPASLNDAHEEIRLLRVSVDEFRGLAMIAQRQVAGLDARIEELESECRTQRELVHDSQQHSDSAAAIAALQTQVATARRLERAADEKYEKIRGLLMTLQTERSRYETEFENCRLGRTRDRELFNHTFSVFHVRLSALQVELSGSLRSDRAERYVKTISRLSENLSAMEAQLSNERALRVKAEGDALSVKHTAEANQKLVMTLRTDSELHLRVAELSKMLMDYRISDARNARMVDEARRREDLATRLAQSKEQCIRELEEELARLEDELKRAQQTPIFGGGGVGAGVPVPQVATVDAAATGAESRPFAMSAAASISSQLPPHPTDTQSARYSQAPSLAGHESPRRTVGSFFETPPSSPHRRQLPVASANTIPPLKLSSGTQTLAPASTLTTPPTPVPTTPVPAPGSTSTTPTQSGLPGPGSSTQSQPLAIPTLTTTGVASPLVSPRMLSARGMPQQLLPQSGGMWEPDVVSSARICASVDIDSGGTDDVKISSPRYDETVLKTELDSMKHQCDQLLEDNGALEEHNLRLKEDLEALQVSVIERDGTIADLHAKISQLEKEMQDAHDERLQSQRNCMDGVEETITKLHSQIDLHREETSKYRVLLQEARETLAEERRVMSAKLQDLNEKLEAKGAETVKRLREEVEGLQKQIDEERMAAPLGATPARRPSLVPVNVVEQQEELVRDLKKTLDETKVHLYTKEEHIKKADTVIRAKTKIIEDLEETQKKLEAELQEEKEKKPSMMHLKQIRDLKKELKVKGQNQEKLKRALEELKKELATVELAKLGILKANKQSPRDSGGDERLQAAAAELQKRLVALTTRLGRAKEEVEEGKKREEDLTRQLDTAKGDLRAQVQVTDKLRDDYVKSQKHVRSLQEKNQALRQEVDDLKAKRSVDPKVEQLQKKIKVLEQQLNRYAATASGAPGGPTGAGATSSPSFAHPTSARSDVSSRSRVVEGRGGPALVKKRGTSSSSSSSSGGGGSARRAKEPLGSDLDMVPERETTVSARVDSALNPAAGSAVEKWDTEKRMQKRVEVLKTKLAEKTKDLESAEQTIRELRTKVSSLDVKMRDLEDKANQTKRKLESQTSGVLTRSQINAITDTQALRVRLEALETENFALRDQIDNTLMFQISELKTHRTIAEERATGLQNALDDARKDMNNIHEEENAFLKLQSMHEKLAEAKDKEADLVNRLLSAENEAIRIRFEKESLAIEKARLHNKVVELSALNQALNQASVKDDTGGAKGAALGTEGPGSSKTAARVRELEGVVSSMTQLVEKLQRENNSLKRAGVTATKIVDVTKENQELLRRAVDAERKAKALEEKMMLEAARDDRAEEASRRANKLAEENTSLKSEVSKGKKEIAALTEELETYKLRTKSLYTAAEDDKVRSLRASRVEVPELQRQLKEQKQELMAVKGALVEREQTIATLRRELQLDGGPGTLVELRNAYTALDNKHADLQNEYDDLKKRNKELQAELDAFDPAFFQEIDKLKHNYEQALREIDRLQSLSRPTSRVSP